MPTRQRILQIEAARRPDPGLVAPVLGIWDRLDEHDCCPFCGCEIPAATFPWPYARHDIYGRLHTEGPVPVCAGSRNVFTLKLLGLERAL